MDSLRETSIEPLDKVEPICPVFGHCGGCAYQDLTYENELQIKEEGLRRLFLSEIGIPQRIFDPIVPSPAPYHYRHRLDIGLYRRASGEILMGFMKEGRNRIVPIESCSIAREEVSRFLPDLKKIATEKLPPKYRTANLVVRTGDDGRVAWGGIGRRSLEMKEEDYFWTEILGKKIFYSLDTFFQANLYILEPLIRTIREMNLFDANTNFYDLYSGVGFFGLCLEDLAKEIVMIEDNPASVRVASYNAQFHGIAHKTKIIQGRVQDHLLEQIRQSANGRKIAMIDPPRKGLSNEVIHALATTQSLDALLYLSCKPESLIRDLKVFAEFGWKIEKVTPFDFFPKTQHLETLVLLRPPR